MNVLITGASGFIGSHLVSKVMAMRSLNLSVAVRAGAKSNVATRFVIENLDGNQDWRKAVFSQDVIIHCAAKAHEMRQAGSNVTDVYQVSNVDGTLNLARQAALVGVKRFIFLSSIKVNGEWTLPDQPFKVDSNPAPQDVYGVSKLESEKALQRLAVETGMEVVIVRPPLVYGLGVKGNFASMIKLVKKGIPLPFGAIHNQRSLVALDNLVDLIMTCIDHPAAANQVFLAGDGKDLSTTELLKGVAKAAGKPARLIPVPSSLLMLTATLLGKKAIAQRLLGSLQVDISKARDLLGWEPPITVEEGLRRCFIKD